MKHKLLVIVIIDRAVMKIAQVFWDTISYSYRNSDNYSTISSEEGNHWETILIEIEKYLTV